MPDDLSRLIASLRREARLFDEAGPPLNPEATIRWEAARLSAFPRLFDIAVRQVRFEKSVVAERERRLQNRFLSPTMSTCCSGFLWMADQLDEAVRRANQAEERCRTLEVDRDKALSRAEEAEAALGNQEAREY